LTPILGFSELLLRRSSSDADERQGLEVIHRNATHLTRVVDDLLLTRARRGGLGADPAAVEVLGTATELAGDHGASVHAHSGAAVAWVDPTHLVQVLTNLLSNASRYGRPPTEVHVTEREDHVEVVVRDHGDGIPPWFEPHLFDEFSQAEVGDRRTAAGLGLGLPIARDLARTNGGELGHVPEGAPGARFVLRLPRAVPDVPRGDRPAPAPAT
jgi:signal transduction histidine kinase